MWTHLGNLGLKSINDFLGHNLFGVDFEKEMTEV